MTPEEIIREALPFASPVPEGMPTYMSREQERINATHAALDALVAERDALAARLAEAEREKHEARAEAAEERVAALEEALREIADLPRGHHFVGDPSRPWDTSYAMTDIDDARKIARAALAAADRPEGTTP